MPEQRRDRGRQPRKVSLLAVVPTEGWRAYFDLGDGGNVEVDYRTVAAIALQDGGGKIVPLAIVGGAGGFCVADFEDGFLGVGHEAEHPSRGLEPNNLDWEDIARAVARQKG